MRNFEYNCHQNLEAEKRFHDCAHKEVHSDKKPSSKEKKATKAREDFRHELAEANQSIVFERQIGRSDFLRINFLERGLKASKAVGRIDIRDKYNNPVAFGTGFMISPRLLMTNAHVLLNKDEGNNSFVEFNFEDDVQSVPKQKTIFSLRADEFFYRYEDLDVAVVAVSPTDIRATVGLDHFGFIRLRKESGKALPGEHVSIIQHPNGRSKEIACRANKIIRREGIYVHYQTDTDRGSSGSPVFTDEWEIVALHHAGVIAKDQNGNIKHKNGGTWTPGQDHENEILWEANEGIRISEIVNRYTALLEQGNLNSTEHALLREALRYTNASVNASPFVLPSNNFVEERRNASWYAAAKGFDSGFFGFNLDLPDYSSFNAVTQRLDYRNFSVVMHKGRRQALFTAVNIDGFEKFASSKSASWKFDPRLNSEFQLGNEFYKNQVGRKNFLDRGHLVKRTDPVWGALGEEAIPDTYHYTNSALQHRKFNNGIWGKLEDALEGRFDNRTVMSVFTGPIFAEDDQEVFVNFNGVTDRAQIPSAFWKVIAFGDDEGWLATAGFWQSQERLIQAMDSNFADEAVEELLTYQIPIEQIEEMTNLDFDFLRDHQAAVDQLESMRGNVGNIPIKTSRDFNFSAFPKKKKIQRKDSITSIQKNLKDDGNDMAMQMNYKSKK